MPVRFEHLLHLRFVVEWSVIHDDQTIWPQLWDQHVLHPSGHGVMRAAALKQHRCEPFFSALRHNEIGALAVIAADFAMHFLAARCPSVGAIAVGCKAAFIEIDDVGAAVALHPLAQGTQIIYSASGMTLRVPRRFF